MPAVVAVLIAYALDPVVTWVTRLRVPRVLAATIVFLGLLAGVGFGGYALRHQAIATIETLPAAAQNLRQKMQELRRAPVDATSPMSKIQEAATEIEKTAVEATGGDGKAAPRGVTRVQIDAPAFRANDYLLSGLGLLSQVVMVAFLVFSFSPRAICSSASSFASSARSSPKNE